MKFRGELLLGVARKILGRSGARLHKGFPGSSDYWRKRYAQGGNSGPGSYSHLACFKAEVLNAFVLEHQIKSVIEFGCGDGNLLRYTNYPSYYGYDISEDAIARCIGAYGADPSKRFALLREYRGETAELALSLDVIFHLVEDQVFHEYMVRLFGAAEKFTIIYSSNSDDITWNNAPHVQHRQFSRWVDRNAKGWKLAKTIKNRYPYDGDDTKTSFSDFFIYAKRDG